VIEIENEHGTKQHVPESAVSYWIEKGWKVIDPQPPVQPGEEPPKA
jgi:hypothetical protein